MTIELPTSTNNIPKPIRIAIIGAGIGGLALGVALGHLIPEGAVKVDIYEQVQEIKEIGAGIFFWPRTWPILQHLGVAEAFEQLLGYKPNTERTLILQIIKSDVASEVTDMFELYLNGKPNSFHRAAVQKTFLDALPPHIQLHLGRRLLSYDESDDEVVLNFDDQQSQACDLLVAADGIKSFIRGEFIAKRLPDQMRSVNPSWGGTVAYRSLIDASKIKKKFPKHKSLTKPCQYVGNGKYITTYPIMQGRFINVVAHVSDDSKNGTRFEGPTTQLADKDHVISLYSGWSDECLELLKSIDTCSQWAIQHLVPLRSFAAGRVALLGDAAHAMPPTQGSGAGQAVEDVYVLVRLLMEAVKENIPIHRVTEAYSKTRQPLANLVLQRSLDTSKLISFRAPGYEEINSTNKETVKMLSERFASEYEGMYDWFKTSPMEDVQNALRIL